MTHDETPELDIAKVSTGQSHLIEANAGTGKTYAIANLFLRFILNGVDVETVLVVTFTNAARDELSARLRKRLVDALQLLETGAVDEHEDDFFKSLLDRPNKEESILRLKQALLSMNEAAIHTIHGFCQQALAEQAFASGQSFDTEEASDKPIRKQIISDWWRKQTYNLSREQLEHYLETEFNSVGDFTSTIEPLLDVNAPELSAIDISKLENTKTLSTDWSKLVKQLLAEYVKDRESIKSRLTDSQYKLKRTKKPYKNDSKNTFLDWLDTSAAGAPDISKPTDIIFKAYAYKELIQNLNNGGVEESFNLKFFHLLDDIGDELSDLQARYNKIIELQKEAEQQIESYKKLTATVRQIQEETNSHKEIYGLQSFDDMIQHLHHAVCEDDNNLAEILGKRFPIIMVDEFQDTDPKQYAIFQRVHKETDSHTLIMIGDPKQAIYSFRGGDIFNYMQASRDTSQIWKLSTNWRSTKQIIQAVNHLFQHSNAFTYEAIPYHDSINPEQPKAQPLFHNGQEVTALTFEPVPVNDDGEAPDTAKTILPLAHEATAKRIAELLADDTACIGNERLKAGDIAVLVRKKEEATTLQKHLLSYGIRAVTISDASVWDSDEAESLETLLAAIASPGDRQLCRQALSAPILNLDLTEIHKLQTEPKLWSQWVELFHALHDQWQSTGFMAAYRLLLNGITEILAKLSDTAHENTTDNIADIWLKRIENPERMITNLGQLAELIQQASLEHPGMEAILAWLRKQKDEKDREEYQIRLESDENLVKMITIHKSKGLQYPVVFLPYLWHCKPVNSKADSNLKMKWHQPSDNGYRYLYTPDGTTTHDAFAMAEHERLAEDVRLAYVALTRAESHCHVFFGPHEGNWKGHTGRTGLAWLLATPDDELNLDETSFEVASSSISLEHLNNKCEHIQILSRSADQEENPQPIKPANNKIEPVAAAFTRKQYSNWRIQSFSAMTRDIHQVTRAAKGEGESYALKFPAGADEGNFLHSLLEHINTTQDIATQLPAMVPYFARKFGLTIDIDKELNQLTDWLQDILNTPLNKTGLTLGSLKAQNKVAELTFDFSTQRIGYKKLQERLEEYAGTELPRVEFQAFEGMVTGAIDLVFEHDGQYFIADYKSNLLGRHLTDYTQELLQTAIRNRRYDLQYLLYTLALHRHLRSRLPDYDYDHHFGGVYYLFLRAMTPATGTDYGIFRDKPPFELIDQLDRELFAPAEVLAS